MQAKILLDQLKVHILQNRETSVESSLTSLLKIIWLGFWVDFATLILFLPITGAALLSTTGNLAFKLSRVWAWIMIRVSNLSVTINGTRKVLPAGDIVFHPGTIEVVVGEPIETNGYNEDNLNDLVKKNKEYDNL